MKRIITLVPLLLLLLTGCQQDIAPDYAEIPDAEVMTRSASSERLGPDDPIVFHQAKEANFWAKVCTLEDRFAAFEVPASRLTQMTTEALVKSALNYPLNYIAIFYENPKDAVDLIINNSPLHQELLSRTDAAEVLVDFYSASVLDMSPGKSNFDGDYVNLSYTNTIFLEHLLGSKVLNTLGRSSVKEKLAEAVAKKLQSRVRKPEIFSAFSVDPLIAIDKAEGLGLTSVNNRATIQYETTIYTPWGQEITARVYNEATATELNTWTTEATSAHPNAIVRGPATHKYNSHSYAWYNQSTSNTIWIPNPYLYDNQIEKYWTDDLYDYISSGSSAEIAYFTSSSHSAIPLANGKFLSKWDNGPLMEHDPYDSPYNSGPISYYKKKAKGYHELAIQGQTSVSMNQTYTYNISNAFSDTDLEWEVRYMDAIYPTPFVLNVSSNGRSATLKCEDYGLFKIYVTGSRNGIEFASGQLNVIATP